MKDDETSKEHETDDILLYSEDENFQKVENVHNIVIIVNDAVYKEFSFDNNNNRTYVREKW